MILLLLTGCKSEEDKIFDALFEIQERALTVLKDNPDDGKEAVKQITALEEETRTARIELRERWKKVHTDPKGKPNKAVEQRFKEYREKFDARLKRYGQEDQRVLRLRIGTLVR